MRHITLFKNPMMNSETQVDIPITEIDPHRSPHRISLVTKRFEVQFTIREMLTPVDKRESVLVLLAGSSGMRRGPTRRSLLTKPKAMTNQDYSPQQRCALGMPAPSGPSERRLSCAYALTERFVFLSDHRTRSAMKLAKGLASTSMLARSRAFKYSVRSSTRTTVHGYPPEASRTFIRKRAMRPLPSG